MARVSLILSASYRVIKSQIGLLPPGFEPGLEGFLGGGRSRLEGPLSLTGLDYGSTTAPERRTLFRFGLAPRSAHAFPALEFLHLT
jgi:hypothetical protein